MAFPLFQLLILSSLLYLVAKLAKNFQFFYKKRDFPAMNSQRENVAVPAEPNGVPPSDVPLTSPPSGQEAVSGPLNRSETQIQLAMNNPPTQLPERVSELDSEESRPGEGCDNLLLELATNGTLLRHSGSSLVPTAESIVSKLTLSLQRYPAMLPVVMGEISSWRRFMPTSENFNQQGVTIESILGERHHMNNCRFFGDNEKFGVFHIDSENITSPPSFESEQLVNANAIDLIFNVPSGPMFLISRISDYLTVTTLNDANEKYLNRLVACVHKLARVHTTNLLLRFRSSNLQDVLKIHAKGEELVNAVKMTNEGLAQSEALDIVPILTLESGIPYMLARLVVAHDSPLADDSMLDQSLLNSSTGQSDAAPANPASDEEPDSVSQNTRSRRSLKAQVDKLEGRVASIERILYKNNNQNRGHRDNRRSRSRSPPHGRRNFMKKGRYSK